MTPLQRLQAAIQECVQEGLALEALWRVADQFGPIADANPKAVGSGSYNATGLGYFLGKARTSSGYTA